MASKSLQNELIGVLPPDYRTFIQDRFEETLLDYGQTIAQEGEDCSKVYFPLSCLISTIATFESGVSIEIAATGREGMVPVDAILGSSRVASPLVVQVAGVALTAPYSVFSSIVSSSVVFQRTLMAYADAYLQQLLQSAACNSVHSAEQRAARWLLTNQDRTGSNTFRVTQEQFAEILGVSRPTANIICQKLEKEKIIRHGRGVITVTDNALLTAKTCECYEAIRRKYRESIAPACLQSVPPHKTDKIRLRV
jgi:CRP-like cAMP-binding protein